MIRRLFPVKRCPEGCRYPVYLRRDTSDEAVYNQVFLEKEYEGVSGLDNVGTIVDCGGYTGLSAVWFLNRYPKARVIVIEPDKRNFSLCRKNLRPYKNRVDLLNMAVWSSDKMLVKDDKKFRDGRDWANRFRAPRAGERGAVQAMSIGTLLKKAGAGHVDILKMDVEEAEGEIFSGDCGWIDKVRNIAVELHDEKLSHIFFRALSGYGFELITTGDLTICRNIKK